MRSVFEVLDGRGVTIAANVRFGKEAMMIAGIINDLQELARSYQSAEVAHRPVAAIVYPSHDHLRTINARRLFAQAGVQPHESVFRQHGVELWFGGRLLLLAVDEEWRALEADFSPSSPVVRVIEDRDGTAFWREMEKAVAVETATPWLDRAEQTVRELAYKVGITLELERRPADAYDYLGGILMPCKAGNVELALVHYRGEKDPVFRLDPGHGPCPRWIEERWALYPEKAGEAVRAFLIACARQQIHAAAEELVLRERMGPPPVMVEKT